MVLPSHEVLLVMRADSQQRGVPSAPWLAPTAGVMLSTVVLTGKNPAAVQGGGEARSSCSSSKRPRPPVLARAGPPVLGMRLQQSVRAATGGPGRAALEMDLSAAALTCPLGEAGASKAAGRGGGVGWDEPGGGGGNGLLGSVLGDGGAWALSAELRTDARGFLGAVSDEGEPAPLTLSGSLLEHRGERASALAAGLQLRPSARSAVAARAQLNPGRGVLALGLQVRSQEYEHLPLGVAAACVPLASYAREVVAGALATRRRRKEGGGGGQ